MRAERRLQKAVRALATALLLTGPAGTMARPIATDWQVVVNNGFEIPWNPGRFYNSYNPPSVNSSALVVFRARSTGRQQGPVSGIYTRDMTGPGAPIIRIADRDAEVPFPNNTAYPVPGPGGGGAPDLERLSTFNEFPAFPRIAMTADAIATRGNHEPVWTYADGVDPDTGEPVETRVGTTGVYVNLQATDPAGDLLTGASLLGAVTPIGEEPVPGENYFPYYAVPGVEPQTRFDVFPGSPAITDSGVIAFKGNYSVDAFGADEPEAVVGKTGVFYRTISDEPGGGAAATERVADSDTLVPNPGACAPGTTFGSTAPPSAAGEHVVFVGFDDEDDPACGGVYRAALAPSPEITTLVGLETRVPGQGNQTFTRIGEGVSFDARFVAFWGAWRAETRTLRLHCPTEGNRIRREYCNNAGPFAPDLGDPNSVCDDVTDPGYDPDPDVRTCYQEKEVPVSQGLFVYDLDSPAARRLNLLARTGLGGQFDDFVYWNYSGAPPGAGEGEGDAEPPRWRSSAFLAVSGSGTGNGARLAFLARTGRIDPASNLYTDPVDGIYLATGPGQGGRTVTLVETGMDGTILDPEAVWDDDGDPSTAEVPLPIASLALERDAFRGDLLAITASMGVEEAGWAGIYLTELSAPPSR